MPTAANWIRILESSRGLEDKKQVETFTRSLSELAKVPLKEADIDALFPIFKDDSAKPEVMGGLMHLLEDLETLDYVRALVQGLPKLIRSAPKWSLALSQRLLNNPEAAKSLGWALKKGGPESKQAAGLVLAKIASENVEPRSGEAKKLLATLAPPTS
jgi:hypothetical protein